MHFAVLRIDQIHALSVYTNHDRTIFEPPLGSSFPLSPLLVTIKIKRDKRTGRGKEQERGRNGRTSARDHKRETESLYHVESGLSTGENRRAEEGQRRGTHEKFRAIMVLAFTPALVGFPANQLAGPG